MILADYSKREVSRTNGRPLRILLTAAPNTRSFWPSRTSGAVGGIVSIRELASWLARRGHEVTVLGNVASAGNEEGVSYLPYVWRGSVLDKAASFRSLRGRVNILIANTDASLLRASYRIPSLRLRLLWSRWTSATSMGVSLGTAARLVDHFIFSSEAARDFYTRMGIPRGKTSVIRNGVDFALFRPAPFEARNPHKIVYAGALVRIKGVDLLLSAFEPVRKRFEAAELHLFGSREMYPESAPPILADITNPPPGVVWHGCVPRNVLADEYRTASVAVVPSDPEVREVLARASIEAQACGCPVVASASGGLPETIDDGRTGFVFRPYDAASLARSIIAILEDSEKRRSMSESAYQRARMLYDIRLTGESLEELLDSLDTKSFWRRHISYGLRFAAIGIDRARWWARQMAEKGLRSAVNFE